MHGAILDPKPFQNMNNFENPGLHVDVHLDRLIREIVVPPNAQAWFEKLVRCIVERSNLPAPVTRAIAEDA